MNQEILEKGELIRTYNGKIDTIVDPNYFMNIYVECKKGIIVKNTIIKHSKNIKDLIISGDIILYRLNDFMNPEIGEVKKIKDARSGKECFCIKNYSLEQTEILQILTRENFEEKSYKVEGKCYGK